MSTRNDRRWRPANLYIDKSTIPGAGLGLFAGSRGFRAQQRVCEYSAPHLRVPMKVLDRESARCLKRKDHAGYQRCWMYVYQSWHNDETDQPYCWDARDDKAHLGRYMNDARDAARNNVQFEDEEPGKKGEPARCWMVTTRAIGPGEELFVSYGDGYWDNLYPDLK